MNNEMKTYPKTITVSTVYVKKVAELLELQQSYFESSARAKKSKLGTDFQQAKELLRQCKSLEQEVKINTQSILSTVFGSMTADEAIAQMKLNLDGKEVRHD